MRDDSLKENTERGVDGERGRGTPERYGSKTLKRSLSNKEVCVFRRIKAEIEIEVTGVLLNIMGEE